MWNYSYIKHLPSFCHCIGYYTLSSSKKKTKIKKVARGVSGFDLYLLIEQLAVLPQIKIICLF